jgi:hypothetical protein
MQGSANHCCTMHFSLFSYTLGSLMLCICKIQLYRLSVTTNVQVPICDLLILVVHFQCISLLVVVGLAMHGCTQCDGLSPTVLFLWYTFQYILSHLGLGWECQFERVDSLLHLITACNLSLRFLHILHLCNCTYKFSLLHI